jgi:uncharacterized membrane protein
MYWLKRGKYMSLIIELLKQYISYVLIALLTVFGGVLYFYAVHYARKYIKQLSNLKYLYASALLVIINIFYLIVSIQRLNQGMVPFARGFAYFLLSLSATIVYTVLAVAYTSNKHREATPKKTVRKGLISKTSQGPKE